MSDVSGVGSGAALAWNSMGGSAPATKPKTVAEAAKAFEALLIGQMLKSSRESCSEGGFLGSGEDSAGVPVMEFAEQQFAQLLASGGGLGLARIVQDGLARGASTPSVPAQSATVPGDDSKE